MKVKLLLAITMISVCGFAQTMPRLAKTLTRTELEAKIENLQLENQSLSASLDKEHEGWRKCLADEANMLAFTKKVVAQHEQLEQDHASLINKYNMLLDIAQQQAATNAGLVRNQNSVNSLNAYRRWPKLEFAPTQILQFPATTSPSRSISCTSNKIGDTVNTECH